MFRKFVFYIQCYKICLNKWNVQIKQKATNQHIKHQSNTHIILTHVMLYLLTHALKQQVFIKYCQIVSKYLYEYASTFSIPPNSKGFIKKYVQTFLVY